MRYVDPDIVPEKHTFETLDTIWDLPAMQLPTEQLLLYALVVNIRPEYVLEIGTAHGGAAATICAALDHNDKGQLIMIDPEPTITPKTWQRLGRGHMITGTSPKNLPAQESNIRFDLVLIDGDHSAEGVEADILGVLPLLNSPAYLLFHDSHTSDVRAGISRALRKSGGKLTDAGLIGRCGSPDWHDPDLNWGGLWLLYYEG